MLVVTFVTNCVVDVALASKLTTQFVPLYSTISLASALIVPQAPPVPDGTLSSTRYLCQFAAAGKPAPGPLLLGSIIAFTADIVSFGNVAESKVTSNLLFCVG